MKLEIKSDTIRIPNQAGIYIKGMRSQSVKNRLKSCYSTNLRTADAKSGSIRNKLKIVSKLLDYEV